MINISSIKTHMYCPMKLYIQNHVEVSENNDFQLAIEIKKLKIEVKDLMQKNIRKLKRDMNIKEIEEVLSENISPYIESSSKSIKSMNLGLDDTQIDDIIQDTCFEIKILSLKSKQTMEILEKDGFAIVEMFFPNCMDSYLLNDSQLELIGMCDKIEIIDGKYYPVIIKSSNPPLKGVWDGDAIELVAHAILIEEEFDTEVFVGFVDYEKIGERRPVVMDVNLRKGLFDVIKEVREIVDNKKLPTVKTSHKKCDNCEYKTICLKEE